MQHTAAAMLDESTATGTTSSISRRRERSATRDKGRVQRVGLATSAELLHWTKADGCATRCRSGWSTAGT